MNTSQPAKTTSKLNPSATEFVPSSFMMPSRTDQPVHSNNYYGHQPHQQQRYNNNQNNQNYHNNYYNNNNNNNNNFNQYRGNNNYHHHNQQNNNMHYNNNNNSNSNYFNPNDVDPIEIEARCEAVIEILQDDNIRDQLNPDSRLNQQNQQQHHHQNNESNINHNSSGNNNNYLPYNDNNQDPQYDDEEEMLEMMAMQEECRLEMMKFYIQSQNPTLFEEIYHDVSYPDIMKPKKDDEPQLREKKVVDAEASKESTTKKEENNDAETNALKQQIVNDLNPGVHDFVPNKLGELNLNDKENK